MKIEIYFVFVCFGRHFAPQNSNSTRPFRVADLELSLYVLCECWRHFLQLCASGAGLETWTGEKCRSVLCMLFLADRADPERQAARGNRRTHSSTSRDKCEQHGAGRKAFDEQVCR